MLNINRVVLAGYLCADPGLRSTSSGAKICGLRMAINHKAKRKDGTYVEDTCFVDVDAWGRTGEAAAANLRKGSGLVVEGRLHYSSWEKDGQRRSKVSVTAERVCFTEKPAASTAADDGVNALDNRGARSMAEVGADQAADPDSELPF